VSSKDVRDFWVGEFACEAVRGEEKQVARFERMGKNIDGNRQLSTDSAGDDVANRRELGLLRCEESGLDLFFDQGVIRGELTKFPDPEEITAAVAYVGDPCCAFSFRAVDQCGDESGSHAAERAVLLCPLMNGEVGGMDSLLEPGMRVIAGKCGRLSRAGFGGRSANALKECIGSQLTGDFAGGRSSHAVADHVDAEFGGGSAGVLVLAPDAPDVRAHGGSNRGVLR